MITFPFGNSLADGAVPKVEESQELIQYHFLKQNKSYTTRTRTFSSFSNINIRFQDSSWAGEISLKQLAKASAFAGRGAAYRSLGRLKEVGVRSFVLL